MSQRKPHAPSTISSEPKPPSTPIPPPSSTSREKPTVPTRTLVTLLGFTFLMISLPLGSYFVTLNTLFNGNTTMAGGTAAVVANLVVVGWIVVAFLEDTGEEVKNDVKKVQ